MNNPINVINLHGCTRQLLERTGLIAILSDSDALTDPASDPAP